MDTEIRLTNAERARFERYAQVHGLASVAEAVQHAATVELDRLYKLPGNTASILNFEGLKRADKGKQDG